MPLRLETKLYKVPTLKKLLPNHKRIWFVCDNGHHWIGVFEGAITHKLANHSCPVCTSKNFKRDVESSLSVESYKHTETYKHVPFYAAKKDKADEKT